MLSIPAYILAIGAFIEWIGLMLTWMRHIHEVSEQRRVKALAQGDTAPTFEAYQTMNALS